MTSPLPPGRSGSPGDIRVPFLVVQNPGCLNLHQFGAYDLSEAPARHPVESG